MKNNNIDIVENLFTKTDIEYFLNKINNKIIWQDVAFTPEKGYVNYYERIPIENFSEYKDILELFLYQRYGQKYVLSHEAAWINKVSVYTNKNDDFHFDNSDLTIVTYLNDDFKGGEFEYIDTNKSKIKIKPKKGNSLLMNNKLKHKVCPVKLGKRFSLVCFFELNKKINKTIL
jgi:hypothetical protein